MVTANINLLSCVSSRKRQLTPARVGLLSSYYEIRTRLSAETCLYWSIQPLLQALIRLTRYANIRVFYLIMAYSPRKRHTHLQFKNSNLPSPLPQHSFGEGNDTNLVVDVKDAL